MRGTLVKVYSVQTPVPRQAFFFSIERPSSHCEVSDTLDRTSCTQSHTHTHARVHAHKHPSCQSRVEPHRLLLSTQSGYLPLCTVSYSNKHQQHSDPDTFLSHAHTRANTHTHSQTHLGTMHFSGVSNGQRLQSTYSFSLKEI